MKLVRFIIACCAMLFISLEVQAQIAFPYQLTTPQGWKRAGDASIDTLTPNSEAIGTAQAMFFPPKPLSNDFDQQFSAERTSLEQGWGLQQPQSVSQQRGQAASGPFAAYFASYLQDGQPRYLAFLAQSRQGAFILSVFVTTSDNAFNRLAPMAVQAFQSISAGEPTKR